MVALRRSQTLSFRNKASLAFYWFLNWIFGSAFLTKSPCSPTDSLSPVATLRGSECSANTALSKASLCLPLSLGFPWHLWLLLGLRCTGERRSIAIHRTRREREKNSVAYIQSICAGSSSPSFDALSAGRTLLWLRRHEGLLKFLSFDSFEGRP